MKKILYLGIIIFYLISCKSKIQEGSTEVHYYPSEHYFNEPNLKKIVLEANIIDIAHSINRVHRNDSLPYIEIQNKNRTIRFIPLRNDYEKSAEKNRLRMTPDSVFLGTIRTSITELGKMLKKHYENKGRKSYLSDSPEKAVVEIVLDREKNGEILIKPLNLLITKFDSLNAIHNNSLKLRIALDYTGKYDPPPFLLEN